MLHDSAVETQSGGDGRYASPKIHNPLCSGRFGPAPESYLVVTEANHRFADTQSNEGEHSNLLAPKALADDAVQMARIIGVESDIEKLFSLTATKGAVQILAKKAYPRR